MYNPARLSVAVPRQEGRTLPAEVQISTVIVQRRAGRTAAVEAEIRSAIVQRAAGKALRAAEARVRWTVVGLSSEAAAAVSIALEASRRQTGAPSEVMTEGARREIPATADIKACRRPDPAVVVAAV